MQGLDFVSLTRISRVCRQLREESLHPQSGCFIPEPTDRLPHVCHLRLNQPAETKARLRACRLLQMHVPCSLFASRLSSDEQAAAVTSLLQDAARCRKLWSLHFASPAGSLQSAQELAMQILLSPAVQSVRTVRFLVSGTAVWTRNSEIRRAICQLPSLTVIDLYSSTLAELAAELALATHARHCDCRVISRDFRALEPLSSLKLETLVLDMVASSASQSASVALALALPSLTSLTLSRVDFITHAQSRALFSQLPALRDLTIRSSKDAGLLLLGAGDVGLSGLPALRRCVVTGSSHFAASKLRRFLHRCPQVDSFVFDYWSFSDRADQQHAIRTFSAWGPPVRVDLGRCDPRPPPSDEDDAVIEQPPNEFVW